MTTLTEFPASFEAGTTVTYQRTPADFLPSAGWALTLYLAGAGRIAPLAATASGDIFTFTVAASLTDKLPKGTYQWVERASKGTEVYTYASGTTEVLPNIARAEAGELQSWAERTLAVVEAALENRLENGMESYSIAGRAVSKIPQAELLKIRSQLRSEVAQLKNPGSFVREVKGKFSGTNSEV
jgi:hypothetical protein